jgi:hypothetical protein
MPTSAIVLLLMGCMGSGGGESQRPDALFARGIAWEVSGGDRFGVEVVSGDFDGDGVAEYAVADMAGVVWLYEGEVLTGMLASAEPGFGSSMAVGDFDGDGLDDLVMANPRRAWLELYPGTPDGPQTWPSWHASGPEGSGLGAAMATGDLDGDGRAELVVGAPEAGEVRVYRGAEFGVEDPPWALWSGVQSFGASVAVVLDADRDGWSDVLVGAPRDEAGGWLAGSAVLYSGGTTLPEAPSWSVMGEALEELGMSVAGADFDGDGFVELAVGAPGAPRAHVVPRRGRVALFGGPELRALPFFGGGNLGREVTGFGLGLVAFDLNRDGRSELAVASEEETWIYAGTAGGTSAYPALSLQISGAIAAHAGAVDGADALLIGSPEGGKARAVELPVLDGDLDADGVADAMDCGANDAARHAGASEACDWVDSDCNLSLVDHFPDRNGNGLPICVDPTGGQVLLDWSLSFGLSALSLADVDGDGWDDVLAGTRAATGYAESDGAVFVLASRPLDLDVDWSMWGAMPGAHAGPSDVGDLNGDGFADLAVGLPGTRSVRVYLGSAHGPPAWHDIELTGAVDFGAAVAIVGDLDGDGLDDLAVGAPASDRAYVFLGSEVGVVDEPAWTGSGTGVSFGSAVAALGDLDADGFQDFGVGAPEADGVGLVSVVRGGPEGPLVGWNLRGTAPGGRFGASLALVGDVDGDGAVEAAVGAPGVGTGTIFVYRGDPAGPVLAQTVVPTSPDGAEFGSALGGLDHNGDGFADLVVGAPGAPPRLAVSVWLGGPEGLSTQPVFPKILAGGSGGFSRLGAVLAVGKLNRDELDDFVVGDPAAAGGARVFGVSGTPDADGDGIVDTWEVAMGLDPSRRDSDGDGLDDGDEGLRDSDLDGVPDALDSDSDGDGVEDGIDNCLGEPNPLQRDADGDGLGDLCDWYDPVRDDAWTELGVTVTDVALPKGLQGTLGGSHKRGRALIFADFDLDGFGDVFVGNPADASVLYQNVPDEVDGGRRFEAIDVLTEGTLAWGGAAGDYDNDGDYDLFISVGGNECAGPDLLLQNQWMEAGVLAFRDVSEEAGITGWLRDGEGVSPMPSAGAVWGDVDRDGDIDLFVNGNERTSCGSFGRTGARNTLWLNDGMGHFDDVTDEAGLADSRASTRHSTLFDYDNDGDLDLYENNYKGASVLWQNQLVEHGILKYRDATRDHVSMDLALVSVPFGSFVSCAEDMNNDGWQDLMVFHRGAEDCSGDWLELPPLATEGAGHGLFINQAGAGFVNHASEAGINPRLLDDSSKTGVMGAQLGDLNADGVLDIFIGNGGPVSGEVNHLFLSQPTDDALPSYVAAAPLIDFPAEVSPEVGHMPPYPYRTHGTVMADIDGDGVLELALQEGGPGYMSDRVQEPNRLFSFTWDTPRRWFKVRPVGDGVAVSRDGIGSRVTLTVRNPDGSVRSLHRTLFGGSCFSAQNGFDLYFGLGDAEEILKLEVLWPEGSTTVVTEDLAIDASRVIHY